MLTVAGISTNVSLLKVTESAAVQFSVNWQPTVSGDANSVGMNLRIHYDSSALELSPATDIYQTGFSVQQDVSEADDRDDGMTSTDRVTKLLWVDLQGTWPGLPAGSRLLTIPFVTKPGFGSTVVNLDATTVNDQPLPRRQVTVNQVPLITGPAANNLTARPEITWTPVPNVDYYDIWISRASAGTQPYLRTTQETNTFTPEVDLDIDRYRVWVQGLQANGVALGWSEPWLFDVRPRGTITEPIGTVTTSSPVIKWLPIAGAAQYDLWVRNLSTGQDQVIRQTSLTTTSYTPLQPLADSNYVWWVQAISSTGIASQWSRGEFSVGGRPRLVAPLGENQSTTPLFLWTSVMGAVKYDLWVNKIDGPAQIIRQSSLTTNSYTPVTPLGSGTYRFWVQAVSGSGTKSLWSEPMTFTIG